MDNNVYKVIVGGNTKQLFGENTNEITNSIYFRNQSTLGNEIFVNFTNNTDSKAFNGYATQNTSVTYYDCANFVNDNPIVSYKNADYNPGYIDSSGDILSNSLLPYRIHKNSVNGQSIPTGCNKINLILLGGGGGGGGNAPSNSYSSGAQGGTAGGIAYFTGLDVSSNNNTDTYNIMVGTEGQGGGGTAAGLNGNDTTFNCSISNGSIILNVSGGFGGLSGNDTLATTNLSPPLFFGSNGSIVIGQSYVIGNLPIGATCRFTAGGEDDVTRYQTGIGMGGAGGPQPEFNSGINKGHGGENILFSPPITGNFTCRPAINSSSGDGVGATSNGKNANFNNPLGYGGGGSGAGPNSNNLEQRTGGNGGKGVAIVFFRYDLFPNPFD